MEKALSDSFGNSCGIRTITVLIFQTVNIAVSTNTGRRELLWVQGSTEGYLVFTRRDFLDQSNN
jgi:hypothetical protein